MMMKHRRCLAALLAASLLLLSGCGSSSDEASDTDSGALTWETWGGYSAHQKFLELAKEKYPDIELEFISYTGGNRTGYSWAQMRAGDIPDIFITSQILDKDLAKEHLVDLSGYPFINDLPTSVLDQISLDGEVYLLPVNYAMYGIFYNKTLMEEHKWEVPSDFAELKALCEEIRQEGLIPGVVGTQLTGGPFSTVFNLAKTDWFTTFEGVKWEQDFLAGDAAAKGRWEGTMDYVKQYMDIGMFHTDPQDINNPELLLSYLGNRQAVFCTAVQTVNITEFPETGDKLGMMPFISKDGGKNIYMYSPSFYFGLSSRLTEPGNEKKLEDAVKLLSLVYSEEGQAAFIDETTPCVMSTLNSTVVPEDALIYDAHQAFLEGRAFPMTYTGWEPVLPDIGQAYKEWLRSENDMDGTKCIARMDELMQQHLDQSDHIYFCESTEDFTLEETGRLVGKALGSQSGADAAMIPLGEFHEGGVEISSGITGKLYAGKINQDIVSTICPGTDGEYTVMSMTGAEAKELAKTGFDAAGDHNPFPYLLVTKGGAELKDDEDYQVAFLLDGYTEETAEKYPHQTHKGSMKDFLTAWLKEQGTVSPDGNPWK